MFNDSLVSLMVMLLLCFIGMLVMFLFVIRSLSTQASVLRENFRQQQGALADLERQLMDMNFSLRQLQRKGVSSDAFNPTASMGTSSFAGGDLRTLFDPVGGSPGSLPLAGNSAEVFSEQRSTGTASPSGLVGGIPGVGADSFAAGLPELAFSPGKGRGRGQTVGGPQRGGLDIGPVR